MNHKLTTQEVADQLSGISVQAVIKKYKKYEAELGEYLTRNAEGQYLFDQDGLEVLRNVGQRKRHKTQTPAEKIEKELKQRIFELEKNLSDANKQVEDLKAQLQKVEDERALYSNQNLELTRMNLELSGRISEMAANNNKGFFRRLLGNRK